MTRMARRLIAAAPFQGAAHAGLLLDRYLAEWPGEGDKKGEAIQALIKQACRIPVAKFYRRAYERWYRIITTEAAFFAVWAGTLEGRLFLGSGEPSSIEAALTLHHVYGVPVIPGSALKGITRAYALEQGLRDTEKKVFEVLFGRDAGVDPDGEIDTGEAGYMFFHNAWWIPDSAMYPLVPEVITVHHPEYYSSKGQKPATDFDSPNPNPQIAVQGSFLFAIEGPGEWPQFAMSLLNQALQYHGIGGKTSAGYGFFTTDRTASQKLEEIRLQQEPPEIRARKVISRWNPGELAIAVGRDWNKTKRQFELEDAELAKLIWELHGELITNWQQSSRGNEQSAFRRLNKYRKP